MTPDFLFEKFMSKKKLIQNTLFWWLDHLELYLSKFDHLVDDYGEKFTFIWYDEDNSSLWEFHKYWMRFSMTKSKPTGFDSWFMFSTIVDDNIVPLFMLRFPLKETWKKSLVIYSSFFIVQDFIWLPIKKFIFDNFLIDSIRRLDIALDVSIPITELLKSYFKWVIFNSWIWIDKKNIWFHQTYYIGEIKSDKNRKYLIRIYDKLLDTWKKKKWFLYPHLKNNSDVRRIELELRPHECQRLGVSWLSLLNNSDDVIQRTFSQYLNKHWSVELPSWIPLKPYSYTPYDLKTVYDETWFIPKDYLSRIRWYQRSVLENTGFRWLCQVLSWVEYTVDWELLKFDTYRHLVFLEAYISHLKEIWVHKSLIRKIAKNNT